LQESLTELNGFRNQKALAVPLSPQVKSPGSGMKIEQLSAQMLSLTDRCRTLQQENKVILGNLEEMRHKNIVLTNEKLELVDRVERASKLPMMPSTPHLMNQSTSSVFEGNGLGIQSAALNTSPIFNSPIPYPSEKVCLPLMADSKKIT
jgi:hypothetical protein